MLSDNLFKLANDSRLVFAVTLALSVLLATQIAQVVWMLVPTPELPPSNVQPRSQNNSSSAPATLSARQKSDQIARENLFGQVETAAPVVKKQVTEAPVSTLQYKLRGIYYSADQGLASVILQKNNGDDQFYRLGDEVDTQIYIDQIQPDHIIINRNGRLEKLSMEKPTAELNANNASAPVARPADAEATSVLRNYKRRYKDNPMALARRFQAVPVYQDGKSVGYKLRALRGERLLEKLNLKPDDVFVAVNGIGLDKPFQALDALKSLTTAEDVSLTVLRNGSEQTLDFTLN